MRNENWEAGNEITFELSDTEAMIAFQFVKKHDEAKDEESERLE